MIDTKPAPRDTNAILRAKLDEANAALAMLSAPISADDERLLPIWVAAAQEAEREEHCEEYDHMAESIGFPTRDELRSKGLLIMEYHVWAKVNLRVSVEASDGHAAGEKIRDMSTEELRALVLAALNDTNGDDDLEFSSINDYQIVTNN